MVFNPPSLGCIFDKFPRSRTTNDDHCLDRVGNGQFLCIITGFRLTPAQKTHKFTAKGVYAALLYIIFKITCYAKCVRPGARTTSPLQPTTFWYCSRRRRPACRAVFHSTKGYPTCTCPRPFRVAITGPCRPAPTPSPSADQLNRHHGTHCGDRSWEQPEHCKILEKTRQVCHLPGLFLKNTPGLCNLS